jgi:hypothetical protein
MYHTLNKIQSNQLEKWHFFETYGGVLAPNALQSIHRQTWNQTKTVPPAVVSEPPAVVSLTPPFSHSPFFPSPILLVIFIAGKIGLLNLPEFVSQRF